MIAKLSSSRISPLRSTEVRLDPTDDRAVSIPVTAADVPSFPEIAAAIPGDVLSVRGGVA